MRRKTPVKRVLFPLCLKPVIFGVFVLCFVSWSIFSLTTRTAQAASDTTINFQARLMTGAGAIVPDGTYNVEFKLYNVSTGGTTLWTETRTSTDRVTVANGYLSVNLGSVTAFPTTINWDQDLYLTLNIGGTSGTPSWNGEMSPRLHLTAVPYAFRAGQLATLQGGNTSTLSFATQTAANSILLPNESGTLCIQSSSNCGFALASGSGNYIQNQSASPQTANMYIQSASSGTTVAQLQGAVGQSADLLQLENSSGQVISKFTSAGYLVLGNHTASGNPGRAYFADGTGDGFRSYIYAGTLTADRNVALPNESGTLCVQNSTNCGFAPSSGSGNYIQNTTTSQSANMYVQAATSGSVAGVFRANASGSGDILDLLNGSGTAVATVSSTGSMTLKTTTNSSTAFQIQNSSAGAVLTVDTSSTRAIVGSTSLCSSGRFCVGNSDTGSGGSTVTNAANVVQINTTGVDTILGQKITLSDISSGVANVLQGLVIDSTGTTNTSANVTSVYAKVNSANAGNLMQLQSDSTTVFNISNTGAATLQNQTNSTAALRVQNAASNQVLNVDTSTNNLISNSSFESGVTGWSVKGSASRSTTSSAQYDGNQALSVTTSGSGGGVTYAYSLTSSTQYSFSIFAKASGSNFSTFEIGRSENGSTDTSCSTGQTVSTGNWVRYTCTFTTGTVSGSTYLYAKQTDATGRTFYLDAAQLETGGTATPYRGAKTSIDGSLLVNGGQLQASNSSFALQVNALSGGNGLLINGNGDNNILENALVVAHPDGTNLLLVNEPLHSTIINGGSGLLSSAALQVNTIDPTAIGLKVTGISGQSADLFNVTNSSGTIFGVGASGSTTVKTTTNSTTAFQVQNSSGTSFLTVDNVNANVTLNGGNSGQVSSWQTGTNSLPTATGGPTAVVSNGYVYSIPGDDGVFDGKPYYAKINTNGIISGWVHSTSAMSPVVNHMTVTLNGYIYVLGGANGTAKNTVQYAQINSDGSIGSWSTTTSLPKTVQLGSATTVNGYIYVVGGNQNGTVGRDVYYAKVNANGTIGSWTTVTNSLPAARESSAITFANGYMFIIGGDDGTSTASTVYYSFLNTSTGAPGAWSTSGNSLPATLTGSSAVVINGYIYVMGGNTVNLYPDTTHMVSSVYYTKVFGNGSTNAWTTSTNPLPSATEAQASVAVNGYIYSIGGYTSGRTASSNVYYTSTGRIQVNGSLDLVGSVAGNLVDGGVQESSSAGGSLTAGNTNIVGSLQVQGETSIRGGLTVQQNLSVGGSLTIGPPAGDTIGELLVLGNKTNSGDPTGINGAMYYNSSLGKFRCYQNSSWQDCVGENEISWTNVSIQSPAGDGSPGRSLHRAQLLSTGQVELQLDIKIANTASSGDQIATLPSWATPSSTGIRVRPAQTASTLVMNAHLDINTDGTITLVSNNITSISWVAIDLTYTP